jgi:hypothetical protein
MLFPMLLGRSSMARAFTVDPARSFLHGKPSHAPQVLVPQRNTAA